MQSSIKESNKMNKESNKIVLNEYMIKLLDMIDKKEIKLFRNRMPC